MVFVLHLRQTHGGAVREAEKKIRRCSTLVAIRLPELKCDVRQRLTFLLLKTLKTQCVSVLHRQQPRGGAIRKADKTFVVKAHRDSIAGIKVRFSPKTDFS